RCIRVAAKSGAVVDDTVTVVVRPVALLTAWRPRRRVANDGLTPSDPVTGDSPRSPTRANAGSALKAHVVRQTVAIAIHIVAGFLLAGMDIGILVIAIAKLLRISLGRRTNGERRRVVRIAPTIPVVVASVHHQKVIHVLHDD